MRLWIATTSLFFSVSLSAVSLVTGKIAKIADGDTVTIESSTVRYKVRLVGVDTPEQHLVTPKGSFGQEPWGQGATDYLAEKLPLGTEVQLQVFGKDKYNRTLGRIFKDKEDINLLMVKAGWAIPYIICEGNTCDKKYFENFKTKAYLEACHLARKNRDGIFDKHQPLKEMPYEFRMRLQNRKPEKWVGDFSTQKYLTPDQYKKIDLCNRVFFMREGEAKSAGFTSTKAE